MILSAIIAKAIPYLIGLMALVGVYWRGKHNGAVKAHRDTLEAYEKRRKAIDNADTGIGATDAERAKRLRQFAEKP